MKTHRHIVVLEELIVEHAIVVSVRSSVASVTAFGSLVAVLGGML